MSALALGDDTRLQGESAAVDDIGAAAVHQCGQRAVRSRANKLGLIRRGLSDTITVCLECTLPISFGLELGPAALLLRGIQDRLALGEKPLAIWSCEAGVGERLIAGQEIGCIEAAAPAVQEPLVTARLLLLEELLLAPEVLALLLAVDLVLKLPGEEVEYRAGVPRPGG